MEKFFWLLAGIIAVIVFLCYVLPVLHRWVVNLYLRFLSDEKVEDYFLRLYEKYKTNYKSYDDSYVEAYVDVVQRSLNYWQERLTAVKQDLSSEILESEIQELEEELKECQQKFDFWNNAYIRVSNDNAVRKYHASLRNS